MRFLTTSLLAAVVLFVFSCEAPNASGPSTDAASVLEATRVKMQTTPTHRYRFTSFWDNRFASSTWGDTMDITHSYLPNSDLGFGFYATGDEYDLLYDGTDKLLIDHVKRKVVRTTAAEIGKDSAYFEHTMCFHGDPKALPRFDALDRAADTTVAGKPLIIYSQTTYTPSTNEPDKDVVATLEYYLDPGQNLVDRIRTISHIENDTIQIIDYVFSDYSFSDKPYAFGESDREKSLAYREISEADDDEERLAGMVKPGEQLHRADYQDIDGNEQMLYGEAGRKTLVMFSFIGCGGCEYALREMKKKDFAIREGVELVYSSPEDDASALKAYFKKKTFPFNGFGKESKMNDSF